MQGLIEPYIVIIYIYICYIYIYAYLLPKLPLRPPGLLGFNCPALLAPAQKTKVITCIFTGLACSGLWRDWPTIGQSAKCQVRAQNCPAHCIYTLKKINCRDCRHDDLPSPCNRDPLLGPTAFALAANCSSRPLTARARRCPGGTAATRRGTGSTAGRARRSRTGRPGACGGTARTTPRTWPGGTGQRH